MSVRVAVLVAYLACLVPLAVFGLHRLVHLVLRRRPVPDPAPGPVTRWPRVTVQVPLYNERYVAERVLRAVAALDYPRDRLQVQVLDDSADDTRAVVDATANALRAEGRPVEVLRRAERTGFKAGALDAGLSDARGELIAVFDADFVPQPDFLRRVVPWFADGVGMVQARWGHLNASESWLTRCQATLLDGHFVLEHAARYRSGRWFNFNGTAGVWRREAIEDAGGWEHDTLTEDLDLSYRAQMAGWRFVYLDDLVVPAELPSTLAALQAQQGRWARGGLQVARKLLGRIWRSGAPLATRLEATTHLLANLAYPTVTGLALFLPLAVWARGGEGVPPVLLGLDLVLFVAASLSMFVFYGTAVRNAGAPGVARRLLELPVVMALGLGLSIAQSRAVLLGLLGPVGSFARTPKKGASKGGYRASGQGVLVLEALMAAWQLAGFAYAAAHGWWASLPFMALFAGGYTAVAARDLAEATASRRSAGAQVTQGSQEGTVQVAVAGSQVRRTR